MKLRNTTIANAKPSDAAYKLVDGQGLYLDVRPTGSKVWRYRYRIAGAENIFTIGEFGDAADQFTLAKAREARASAAKLIADGIHPRSQRQQAIAAQVEENRNTFKAVAEDWLETKLGNVTAGYHDQITKLLAKSAYPFIGDRIVRTLDTPQILDVLQRLKATPPTALLLKLTLSQIFCYAVMTRRAIHDPTYPLRRSIGKRGTVIKTKKVRHNPHLTLADIPALLKAIDQAPIERGLKTAARPKLAVRLLMLTMSRSCELANARWSEFDMKAKTWTIPAERMKMRAPHVVPLSRQALDVLAELKTSANHSPLLFPLALTTKKWQTAGPEVPVHPTAFVRYLWSLGYKGRLTAHGFRGTASTILNEVRRADGSRRFDADWIEYQLAHKPHGVRGAYNHASYIEQRADMMQFYADLVMPRKVIPMRKAA